MERQLLADRGDNTLILWDVATGEVLHTFSGHTSRVTSVAFAPDGTTALSGSCSESEAFFCAYGELILWDVATGEVLRSFRALFGWVNSVAYAPAEQVALSAWEGGSIILWDLMTGSHLDTFQEGRNAVNSAVFSPDGHYILRGSANNTLRLRGVETGESLRVFIGHTSQVTSVAFSPDGRYALSGSRDTTLRLWDVATGDTLRVFSGHTGSVNSVAFSPDGRYVLSGSDDDTLRLWDADYRDFIAYACTRVFRDFTPEERTHFGITDDEPTCPQFASTTTPAATPHWDAAATQGFYMTQTTTHLPTQTLTPAALTALGATREAINQFNMTQMVYLQMTQTQQAFATQTAIHVTYTPTPTVDIPQVSAIPDAVFQTATALHQLLATPTITPP